MNLDNKKKIQHLYWRAGFGLNPYEWEANKSKSVKETATKLIQTAKNAKRLNYQSPYSIDQIRSLTKEQKKQKRRNDRKAVATINLQWLQRMSDPNVPALLEKMSLFWHNHFACEIKEPNIATQYLNVLRQNALGNFKDLVLGIAKSPAMILYLNNKQNRKQKPNENFARELMELFTIGRGNYSELDVKAAAKAFTGWTTQLGQYHFKEQWHDYGKKTFMGQTGNFDGEEIIDILLSKKETARFITRKIYTYFVNDQADDTIIQKLADQFYETNYDIGQLMQSIFTSDWFYNAKHIGTRIKSPMEFLAGMIRVMGAKFEDDLPLIGVQKALGQTLFKPPNVAGWPGGRAWIDNATLLLRLNIPNAFLDAEEIGITVKEELEAQNRNKKLGNVKIQVQLDRLEKTFGPLQTDAQLLAFSEYLIQPPVAHNLALVQDNIPRIEGARYFKMAFIRLISLPEYQLC